MKLRVDYDALESSCKILIDQGNTFEDCIGTMTQTVNGLPDIWEAETCDQYVTQYNEIHGSLMQCRDLIQQMADQMQSIVNNFREADSTMRSQMMK